MLKVNNKEVRTNWMFLLLSINSFPVSIYLFKVNIGNNIRNLFKINKKKTSQQHHCSAVFIVDFE